MQLRFDNFVIDHASFELRRDETVVPVEPLVFDLLCFLAGNAGRVLARHQIIDHVWKGRVVSDATISSCIKSARRALGDDGDAQTYIRTVRGRGYQFVAGVESSDDAPTGGSGADLPDPAREGSPPSLERRAGDRRASAGDGELSSPRSTAEEPLGSSPRSTAEEPLLAVLPFDNLSAGVDEYFADGLTEDIITNLARFRDLKVIGRSSTFRFKGKAIDLGEVRASLRVGYVVEGSVRRAAGRVRISVQLTDAATGVHLWAERFDRDMEDIFAVQDEVTRTIAATLGVKIQDAATQRALRKSAAELDAYDCLLRARRYTSLLSPEAHAEARDLLERAVEQDPNYAEAHALLANVYLAEHRFDSNPRPDPIGRSLRMAQRATHLDPQSAYARCWLGIVHFFRGENDRFEAETQRALTLNPNDPETLADVGHYLAFLGEFERGVELSRRARELNPLHPGWYYFSSARYHYHRKDYEEVLADVERIDMPQFYWFHLLRAAALGQLARPGARSALEQIYALKPEFVARTELEKWNAAPKDLQHLMQGLKKAGLED